MVANPSKTKKKYTREQSIAWFKGIARKTVAGQRRQLMTGEPNRYRTAITPGQIFCYYYDPKNKDTLPVYDRFPLCIPFSVGNGPNGPFFTGLNLHYLSVGQRDALLELLMRYASDDKLDENTKLQLSWKAVTATSKMKALSKKAVHSYLYNHVRSRFVQITIAEMQTVSSLPVQDFVYQ